MRGQAYNRLLLQYCRLGEIFQKGDPEELGATRANESQKYTASLELVTLAEKHEALEPLFEGNEDKFGIMREKGKFLFACGKYDEAIILLKSYVSRTDVLDRLEVAKLSGLLGAVYLAKGKMKRALTPCLEALFIHEQRFGKDHIDCAGFVCLLGSIFHRRGRYRKAIQQCERVLEIVQKTYRDKNHIKAVDALNAMGLSLLHLGRCEKAAEKFQNALDIIENEFGKDHFKMEGPIFNLGACCLFQGHPQEALEYYKRANTLYGQKLCAEEHPKNCIFPPFASAD